MLEPASRQPPVRRQIRRHRRGHRQHAAGRAEALQPQARRPHLREARGPQPDRLGQGPRGPLADRARGGGGPDRARPDDPRADLRQHRDLAGDDLPAQGLPAQGGHARQRDPGADPAAQHVRGRDRLLAGRAGLERRGGQGARDGRGRRLLLHALPVREPGEPGRPLQRHGRGDPRGARRGDGVRRRARHRRDPDGERTPPQGGEPRHADRGGRAAPGRAGPGAALAGGRLHPADHRPLPARQEDLRLEPRRRGVDQAAARRGGPLRRRLERRDRRDRRARGREARRGQRGVRVTRRRLEVPQLRASTRSRSRSSSGSSTPPPSGSGRYDSGVALGRGFRRAVRNGRGVLRQRLRARRILVVRIVGLELVRRRRGRPLRDGRSPTATRGTRACPCPPSARRRAGASARGRSARW